MTLVDVKPATITGSAETAKSSDGCDLIVEWVSDLAALESIQPQWTALASRASEPNPFYEPWMLLPALRSLRGDSEVRIALLWSQTPGGRQLIGLFPLERIRRLKGLPVARMRMWQHVYCFLCTPLIDRDHVLSVLDGLLRAIAADRRLPSLVELNFVAADSPVHVGLLDACRVRDWMLHVLEVFPRALLRSGRDFEAYLAATLTRKRRKEITRLGNRLSEQGRIEFSELTDAASLQEWIDAFLALESAGWKGREGTSLASDPRHRAYFVEFARAAFAQGRLQLLRLALDGVPIAMKCNLRGGDGAFAFKIAFDERYAAFSPGVQLEMENSRRLLSPGGAAWMDSCAVSDHFMANQLWPDRRVIQSSLIAVRGGWSEFVLSVLPLFRWAARRWRALRSPQGAAS